MTFSINVTWPAAIAGKPPPTGFVGVREIYEHPKSL
jgi:hypothetical protein